MAEILDMQHRLYGWHLKYTDLADRLRKAQDRVLTLERDPGANTDPGMIAALEDVRRNVAELKGQLARFSHETITIEVMVLSEREHRTLFAMIADKALAINAAQIADYDDTQALNRIAHALGDNDALLKGRVDWVRTNVTDTLKASNPALLSGRYPRQHHPSLRHRQHRRARSRGAEPGTADRICSALAMDDGLLGGDGSRL